MKRKIPLSRPDHPDDPTAIVSTLREIILSGRWTQGEFAASFEQEVAQYCGAVYAVASNSGASGLEQILKSTDLSEDDEVICPSYTFIATANAILAAGAKPVFADIDIHNYNIDIEDVARKVTPKTKAIMLVHQFGIPANGKEFSDFCRNRNLTLVEDAACGFGSKFRNKALGTFGVAGLLSFHPRKVLSTGEGGMILTDDETLALRARTIGNHGRKPNELMAEQVGHNYRMSEFQAALGLSALERLNEGIARRIKISGNYHNALQKMDGIELVSYPEGGEWNCQSYPIRILGERRDLIAKELNKEGIETSFGAIPVHVHPFIEHRFHPPRLPETERAYHETLLLPMYAAMTPGEQDCVISNLVSALHKI